jgi:tRNA A-37 threonylcarbamoyl transferase component Bud32
MNPEKIGRYEIKAELGRGGMATVYQGYDPRFEREVAIKVLPREMLHDPQFRVRFEREAKTIAMLEHTAIVPVYDFGEDDGQPYFVMRYMTGGSLADRIAKGPMSVKESARIMEKLAAALDDAHAKGIIHRDLKPGNILFDRTDEPFISDFGIAKIIQAQGSTVTGGAIIGTPAYMSPEQAQGEGVDSRSDIYSLGVILYEMLSGKQPFGADTPMAIVVKHITEPVPHILDANPKLPAEVEPIIEKALAKSKDDRFASAGDLADALTAVARGERPDLTKTTMAITRARAGKTRLGPQPAAVAGKTVAAGSRPNRFNPLFIIIPLLVIGIGAVGVFALGGTFLQGLFATPAQGQLGPGPSPTTPVVAPPTDTPVADRQEVTATAPAPGETPAAQTGRPVLGGADEIAFIVNNDVWIMNVDGSDLRQLTNDRAVKSDLQWLPDGKTLIFISGRDIKTVDAESGRVDTMTTFISADFLEGFQVSRDGKYVAISLNREMWIVDFDPETLSKARTRTDLKAMVEDKKGCIAYKGATEAAVQVKDFRWGTDDTKIAWSFAGVSVTRKANDLIRLADISACNPDLIKTLDEFPGTHYTPTGYSSNPTITDFDWDGEFLFLLNSFIRNGGWGDLYVYNTDKHKASIPPINPIDGSCCYRDARWSPDRSYIFFAYQDINLGPKAVTQFYYIPYGAIGTGATFTPIPMPKDFFKNPREAPQPALHPAH